MYFNCDEKIADKLFASANKLENTRAEKGTIASGDIFISERRKRIKIGKPLTPLRVKWKVRRLPIYAQERKYRAEY